jgi:hypothetical protein
MSLESEGAVRDAHPERTKAKANAVRTNADLTVFMARLLWWGVDG